LAAPSNHPPPQITFIILHSGLTFMVVGLLGKESDSAHSSTEVQLPRPCTVPLPGESSVHRLASTLHPGAAPPSRLSGTPHPGEAPPSRLAGTPHPGEAPPSRLAGTPHPVEASPSRLAGTPHPVEASPSRLAGTPHPGDGLFPLAAGSLFLAFRYILQSILSLQKGLLGGSSLCPVPNF
jgi:hypothetical protein